MKKRTCYISFLNSKIFNDSQLSSIQQVNNQKLNPECITTFLIPQGVSNLEEIREKKGY